MIKKFFVVFLIFMMLFTYNSLCYFQAKADTLVLTATSLSFMSGFGEVLLAAALVGVAGYMTYKTISSIMARRMTAAYNSMTTDERTNLDNMINTWDGTSNVTLSYDQVKNMGGEKILNSIVSESLSYTPVEIPDTDTKIYSVPQIGSYPSNNVNVSKDVFIHTDNADDSSKIMCNKDIKLQVYIEYKTVGVDFYSDYVYGKEYSSLGGLATLINYKVLDFVTGISYSTSFSILISDFLINRFLNNGYIESLDYGNVAVTDHYILEGNDYYILDDLKTISQKAELIASAINSALGVNLLTGQDVFPTIPLIGNGSIEYSPPLSNVSSVSLPQSITLNADPGVYYNDRDIIPLIPPTMLDSNPDIKTALETGTKTSTMTNDLSISTPTADTGTILGAIQSVLDAINRFFDFSKQIDLNPLKLSGSLITTKFPFCLPWDLKNAILKFNGTGERPNFNISINNKLLGNQNISIDMSIFEPILDKVKIIETILFTLGLVMLTPKLIGGDR